MQESGKAFNDMKQMGLSGETPLGEAKTKAPNSDYHKNEPPAVIRQAEVARDYLKRAARIGELNGLSSGSDGPMVTAPNRHNGGRVLAFVMGAFAAMSGDVSRICGIIATTWRGSTSRTTTTMPSAPRACTGSASKNPGGTWRTAAQMLEKRSRPTPIHSRHLAACGKAHL